MSRKVQKCTVSIECIDKGNMENSKRKGSKNSRQSTPVPAEPTPPPENVEIESTGKAPDAKNEPSHSNNAKITNGRGKSKKEKAGNKKSNGVWDIPLNANGTSHVDGPPSADEPNPEVIDEEALVLSSEQDNDELFPELIYDETSDNECNFDSSSPEFTSVGRSATRRSQAKIIPTPETPQMLNSKTDSLIETSSSPIVEQVIEISESPSSHNTPQPDQTPQKEKVLMMKDMYSLMPAKDSPTSDKVVKDADGGKSASSDAGGDSKNTTSSTTEVSHSKIDTNYSKSRIKVSPYRRSARISDQYSTMANYSGNNSTQDTDLVGDISSSSRDRSPITDGSEDSTVNCSEETSQGESQERSYSDSFRSIKGRKSYRPLREYSLKNLLVQRHKAAKAEAEKNDEQMSVSVSSVNATVGSEIRDTMLSEPSPKWTPVGHVVGRKRKQSPETQSLSNTQTDSSPAIIASESEKEISIEIPSKRQRLLGYVSTPLRNLRDKMSSSTPLLGRYTHTTSLTVQKESVVVSGNEEMPAVPLLDQQTPMVADAVHEHKWCSIM